MTTWARSKATSRRRSLPWSSLMVAVVVLGIVGMHGLALSQSSAGVPAAAASLAGVEHDMDDVEAGDPSPAHSSSEDRDRFPATAHACHTGFAECSSAMVLCLALLWVVGLVLLACRSGSWRFDSLWRSLFRAPLGRPRLAFPSLTPLQRTTILRC